jgi:F-type H+-transporting ATPase subunit delta
MTNTGGLYGKSLYDLAVSENLSEDIMEQMQLVQELFRENPDYIRLLQEPSIPKKERLDLLDQAFGDALQPYLLNFLKLLTERGFLREYPACVKGYREQYCQANGIVDAMVVSAAELDPAQRQRLQEKLQTISGKKVILHEKTDASVLGGVRVEMDGKLYDGTVQGRLSDLRKHLNETVL